MNKKTRFARRNGFASMKDMRENGTKIFSGSCCDTSWDNENSKHRFKKNYSKNAVSKYSDV